MGGVGDYLKCHTMFGIGIRMCFKVKVIMEGKERLFLDKEQLNIKTHYICQCQQYLFIMNQKRKRNKSKGSISPLSFRPNTSSFRKISNRSPTRNVSPIRKIYQLQQQLYNLQKYVCNHIPSFKQKYSKNMTKSKKVNPKTKSRSKSKSKSKGIRQTTTTKQNTDRSNAQKKLKKHKKNSTSNPKLSNQQIQRFYKIMEESAIKIQKIFRGYAARTRYKKIRRKASIINFQIQSKLRSKYNLEPLSINIYKSNSPITSFNASQSKSNIYHENKRYSHQDYNHQGQEIQHMFKRVGIQKRRELFNHPQNDNHYKIQSKSVQTQVEFSPQQSNSHVQQLSSSVQQKKHPILQKVQDQQCQVSKNDGQSIQQQKLKMKQLIEQKIKEVNAKQKNKLCQQMFQLPPAEQVMQQSLSSIIIQGSPNKQFLEFQQKHNQQRQCNYKTPEKEEIPFNQSKEIYQIAYQLFQYFLTQMSERFSYYFLSAHLDPLPFFQWQQFSKFVDNASTNSTIAVNKLICQLINEKLKKHIVYDQCYGYPIPNIKYKFLRKKEIGRINSQQQKQLQGVVARGLGMALSQIKQQLQQWDQVREEQFLQLKAQVARSAETGCQNLCKINILPSNFIRHAINQEQYKLYSNFAHFQQGLQLSLSFSNNIQKYLINELIEQIWFKF